MTRRTTPVTDLERVRERVENLLAGAQRFAESSTDAFTSVGFSAQAEVLSTVIGIIDEEAAAGSDEVTPLHHSEPAGTP
jgi:hypothetical protein